MSEPITFREIKLEGGWLMVKPEKEDLGKAMALVRKHKNKIYNLEVKEYRRKRSLDANAYAWTLIHKLALSMQITPLEVYRQAIVNVGCNHEIIPIKEEAAAHFKKIWEAKGLGCFRLASRISDLKKQGYPIISKRVNYKNRLGECKHFNEYKLKEETV